MGSYNMKKSKKNIIKESIFAIVLFILMAVLIVPIFKSLNYGLDLQGGFEVLYEVKSIDGKKVTSDMVTNTYKTLAKRIDEFGVTEPVITVEGDNKIRVQLAGVTDAEKARENISKVANLTFRDVDDNIIMTSDVLRAGMAKVSTDSYGKPAVALSIKDNEEFYRVTKKISSQSDTSKRMIVIWLDFEDGVDSYSKEGSNCGNLETSRCLSAATVSQAFSSDVIIQGSFSEEQASELVKLINSGSLPTKLEEISSKTVAASFGENSLNKTITAGIVGVVIIMLFMIYLYRFSGFISSVALMIYTVLTFAIFWVVGGTLTLPGIAAVVIGIGMAVDANVISFSRIKDELYKGNKLSMAFKNGNKNSFSTIFDSNFTTFIIALILFILGESSVKGFATMLMISVVVTMFVMVFLNRHLLARIVNTKYFDDKLNLFIGVKEKDIPDINSKQTEDHVPFKNFDFVGKRKWYYTATVIFICVGVISLFVSGLNLGIDFKGGSAVTINTTEKTTEAGLKKDFQELDLNAYEITYASDHNIIINVDKTLEKEEIAKVNNYFEEKYHAKTDIGVVSNVVKNELIKNAILSVIIASIAIILYISFRFTFKYAICAIIALLHDVFAIIALFSLLRLEVSSIFIAAILSIIGYSINDTIVTFDRIRENINTKYKNKLKTKEQLSEVVNASLRSTLVRSLITSITTIIPVISLILLGSHDIINFNLALLFGLIMGTYSSIFIASELWYDMNKKNVRGTNKKKWYQETYHEKEELKVKGINA